MGNTAATDVKSITFDLKFKDQSSDSMEFHIDLVSDISYKHVVCYTNNRIRIYSYSGTYTNMRDNKCAALEFLFKDLQKLADKTKIYDESLKNSHAYESLKNNITYTIKMFGELPIDFLGKHLLYAQ